MSSGKFLSLSIPLLRKKYSGNLTSKPKHNTVTARSLPIEILELIFLFAARDPSLGSLTSKLIRLSRWVHDLLQPHLYHTVTLTTTHQAERFLYSIVRRPEKCGFIVCFNAPRVRCPVPSDLNSDFGEKSDLGAHARMGFGGNSSKKIAPTIENMAPILRHLMEQSACLCMSAEDNDQHNDKPPPKAARLQSATLHAQYLGAQSARLLSPRLRLPPMVTLTGAGHLTLAAWDLTNVQKLRFVSKWMVMLPHLVRIFFEPNPNISGGQPFSNLPNLTHISMPIIWDTKTHIDRLLDMNNRKLSKVVIFGVFDDNSTVERRQIPDTLLSRSGPADSSRNQSVTAQSGKTMPVSTFPTPVLTGGKEVTRESEKLAHMLDERLIIFDLKEIEKARQISNEVFWGFIEGL